MGETMEWKNAVKTNRLKPGQTKMVTFGVKTVMVGQIGDDYFATEGLTAVNLFAYGDSKGDDHMLAMADHPLRIDHLPVTVAPEMSMQ